MGSNATMMRMEIERSIWAGHSWAGSFAMGSVLHFPNAVTGAVLLGGAAYPCQGGMDWSKYFEFFSLEILVLPAADKPPANHAIQF